MTTIGGLLDTSRQALNAQTQSIRVTGDNIANVNTPGYTRRRGDLVTRNAQGAGGVEVGTGVVFDRSVRITDKFLNDELTSRISDTAYAEIRDELLSRAESPFSLDGATGRIGFQFNEFFGALEDLQTNPADIPLRTQAIQKGSDLVNSIRESYNQVASLQREADERIEILIEDANRLTASIAAVNFEITKADTSQQEALTLRDQRDKLVNDLGKLISFESVENSDGTLLLYVQNGFPLVNGSSSRDLTFQADATLPPGLDGNPLRQIGYEVAPGVVQDLTNVLSSGTGEIGGLLSLRGVQNATDTTTFDTEGDLVDIATHIEYITRDLLTRFNFRYLGGNDDAADFFGDEIPDNPPGTSPEFNASALDLDGNSVATVGDQPTHFALFSFEGAAAQVAAIGANGDISGDGVPTTADLATLETSTNISSFSRILTFNVSDEREFATARDLDPAAGSLDWAPGDSSNIDELLGQRNITRNYGYLGLNRPEPIVLNSTIEGLYGLVTSKAGGLSARAADDAEVFQQREAQVRELQQSVSGVNLDEEFAKLINFQRGFEAAARMIRVGDELFNEILALLG